jgi:hypothetical protein
LAESEIVPLGVQDSEQEVGCRREKAQIYARDDRRVERAQETNVRLRMEVEVEEPDAFDCDPGPLASPVEEEVEEDADREGEEDEEDADSVWVGAGGVEIEHRIEVPPTRVHRPSCVSIGGTYYLSRQPPRSTENKARAH